MLLFSIVAKYSYSTGFIIGRHSEITLTYIQIAKTASLDYEAIDQRKIDEASFKPSR
jgi:hypothetical protein